MRDAPDLYLYTDGASRGNPGPAAIGYAIRNPLNEILEKEGRYVGKRTNNEAEWEALLWGLERALERTGGKVVAHSDSLDVVSWVKGDMEARDRRMRRYRQQVLSMSRLFGSFDIVYLPREDSRMKLVDALVNEVLEKEGHARISRR